jgi:peptidoglycan-associated lipoprotein
MIVLAAFMTGGCAKKEVVSADEPVVKTETVKEAPKAEEPAKSTVAEPPRAVTPPPQVESYSPPPVAEKAFESVYFDFDKSDLKKDARDILSRNAAIMKEKPAAKIRIEGNCDERGSAEYNLALGERRAKSAMQYLVTLGIAADRITTLSYGKEKATVNANDEAVWSKDRRDDFFLVK